MAEEQLIEAVREHSELYDCSHANYMKTKLKNLIWADISKALSLKDGEEAKTLWLKLRGSYRDARRRQLRCLKSGAAPENIKPWRYQKQMSFLETFMSSGPREGNINLNSDDDVPMTPATEEIFENEEIEADKSQDDGHEGSTLENANNGGDEGSSREMEPAAAAVASTSASIELPYKKSKKTRKEDDFRSLIKRSMEKREERARQRAEERRALESNNTANDPLYNFFISMYQTTSKMPPHYQHKIKSQLFQVVSLAEEEIMTTTSRPPPFSYHYNTIGSPITTPSSPHSPSYLSL